MTKNDKQKMLFLTLVLWFVRHQKYVRRDHFVNLTALSHCCVFLADRGVADVPSSSFQEQRQRRQCFVFGWPPIFQQGRAPLLDIVFLHMTSISQEIGELKKLIQNYMKEESVPSLSTFSNFISRHHSSTASFSSKLQVVRYTDIHVTDQ